jgi:hypothetical protein
MPCQPAPPCEPTFPLFCEPLLTTTDGRRLVVEDSASCQKTITTTPFPSVLKSTNAGTLTWEGGSTGSVLSYTTAGNIEFVDGSNGDPLKMPSTASHTLDNVPKTMVMLADGTVKVWEPSLTADKFIAYWDGGDWRVNTLNSILPSGQGVFIRDTANNLQIVPNGISGSTLQIVGTSPQFVAAPPNQLPQGYLFGLTIENNGGSPFDTLDINIGRCRSSDNTSDLVLSALMTKYANTAWNQGTNAGGLDSGSLGANQTWHVYVISNLTVVDVIFSQNGISPTLPSGYSLYRRIGSFTTNASSQVRAFSQIGNRFMYTGRPVASQTGVALGVGGNLISLNGIPNDLVVKPIIASQITSAVAWAFYESISTYPSTDIPGINNTAASTYLRQGQAASMVGAYVLEVYTNTVRQIGIDVSAAISAGASGLYIDVYGWYDDRGQSY